MRRDAASEKKVKFSLRKHRTKMERMKKNVCHLHFVFGCSSMHGQWPTIRNRAQVPLVIESTNMYFSHGESKKKSEMEKKCRDRKSVLEISKFFRAACSASVLHTSACSAEALGDAKQS